MENAEEHLFADNEYRLVHASAGKRFANYIIDVLFFYFLAFVAINVIAVVNPAMLDSIDIESRDPGLGQSLLFMWLQILDSASCHLRQKFRT